MRGATAIAAAATLVLLLQACHHKSAATDGGGKRRGGADGSQGPIPVTVAPVAEQDVPIYLNGLGAVLAFNTATILAQVSGQLVAVPFKEGDEVKAGDLLAQVDPRTYQAALDQALAKKAQDQAALASARLDLKRYEALLPEGYVMAQQVDQQRATVASDAALVQADDAAIEADRVQLSYCTIRAPFPGVVGIRQVDVGNLVSASNQTGIVVLTQIKPISVTFTLPEQALEAIRKADQQPLTVVAVSRDNQAELARGRLTAFDNQIDQSTGTIKLKATFDNADKALWPGQFVNVRLLVRTQRAALTVPTQAVQLGPNGSFVYVAGAQGTAEMRPVTPGATEGGVVVIAQGLKAGEKIVVDGQSRLQPGARLQASEAPAATPAPPAAAAGPAPGEAAPDETARPAQHRHDAGSQKDPAGTAQAP
ncbi:MAG: efflux RND transporter periplasmic adaptor subunit [Nevskia sp.]|nr:efflux RND transporter periplasmic adaptor subunit [Nevskia sp.]